MENSHESNFICSIIGRAVEDARKGHSELKNKFKKARAELIREDAIRWLNSDSTEERSFKWYCDLIAISPEWVRRKI